MAAYLAEHVPHLQSLHRQLGLSPDAQAADEVHIEDAIREAVSSLIRNREGEVGKWRGKIERAEDDLRGVRRAMSGSKGDHGIEKRDSDEVSFVFLLRDIKLIECRRCPLSISDCWPSERSYKR